MALAEVVQIISHDTSQAFYDTETAIAVASFILIGLHVSNNILDLTTGLYKIKFDYVGCREDREVTF
jgi:hypothetical protein